MGKHKSAAAFLRYMYEHFYPRFLTRLNGANAVKYSVSRIYARFGGVAVHVETVVLLSDKRVDGHINIDLDVEKLKKGNI